MMHGKTIRVGSWGMSKMDKVEMCPGRSGDEGWGGGEAGRWIVSQGEHQVLEIAANHVITKLVFPWQIVFRRRLIRRIIG